VDSHGGQIDVLSQYGSGSKFFFDLDLLPCEDSEEGLLQNTESDLPTLIENPSAIGLVPIQRLCYTLIVDDSLMNRKLMRKILSSYFDQIDEVILTHHLLSLLRSLPPPPLTGRRWSTGCGTSEEINERTTSV
jgi:hypothetical protein